MKRNTNQARTEKNNKVNSLTPRFRADPKMASWGDDELYFFAESIYHARKLSMCDGLKFLRGMVKLCGHIEQIAGLRAVVCAMTATDAQLDLLAIGLDPTTSERN